MADSLTDDTDPVALADLRRELMGDVLDLMSEGVAVIGTDGRIALANSTFEHMFGYEAGELIGKAATSIELASDAGPAACGGERHRRRKDGTIVLTLARVAPLRHLPGHRMVIHTDMTAVRRAEAVLRECEARLRLAMDAARMAVWQYDVSKDEISGSPELYALLGFDPGYTPTINEVRGRYAPGERDRITAAGKWALEAGERFFQTEFRYLGADGTNKWLLLRAEARLGPAGLPVGAIGVLVDITAQKEVETQLVANVERFRLVAQTCSDVIWDWDVETNVSNWSPNLAEVIGHPEEAINPKPAPSIAASWQDWDRYIHPADRQRVQATFAAAIEHQQPTWVEEFRFLGADRVIWLIERDCFVYDEKGKLKRVVGSLTNITPQKEALERQALLLGELNHRVKNTLATVQAIASQTLRNTKSPEEFARSFSGRIQALSRAHSLLTRSNWEGGDLGQLLRDQLASGDTPDPRIHCAGPDLVLGQQAALYLGLVIHELATNARKHGGLSVPTGSVRVEWRVDLDSTAPRLKLAWTEADGPIVDAPPTFGFGRTLIERGLSGALGGSAKLDFQPQGLRCDIELPIEAGLRPPIETATAPA